MEKWKIQKYYYVSKKTYDRLQWYACTKSVNVVMNINTYNDSV